MKYYAVKKGRRPGIYTNWEECQQQVNGYTGCQFKSFKTLDEAKSYMSLKKKALGKQSNKSIKRKLVAYVDGSFSNDLFGYSFGCVFLENGEIIDEMNGAGFDPSLATMRNVAGEIQGAMEAVNYAIEKGYDKIDIYYDYEGIEKWALSLWKTNKPATKAYKDFMVESSTKIRVGFHKVVAHTGVAHNERADALAKKALGIKK